MDLTNNILIIFLVFMFGAALGSFIGLVATRMNPHKPKKSFKEIFVSPSHCDFTGMKLGPLELVPVFSYIFQGGKSRKKLKGKPDGKYEKLPLSYLVLEVICGIAAVLLFWVFITDIPALIIYSIVVFSFIYLGYFDYLYWEIQLGIIIFNFFLILFFYTYLVSIEVHDWKFVIDRLLAAMGGIAFILFFIALSKGKGLGLGDAWIMGIMGLVLGFFELFIALTIASVVGSLLGLIKAYLFEGKVKGVMIQFVPFLSFGFIITLLFGKKIFEFVYL